MDPITPLQPLFDPESSPVAPGVVAVLARLKGLPPVRLASASPRRLALLRQVGVEPAVWPVEADETPLPGEDPPSCAERLACAKVALASAPGVLTLGADTVVALGDEILGKPVDLAHAGSMLARLSGREHAVTTGIAARWGLGPLLSRRVTTRVWFRPLDQAEIDVYLASEESMGKAGGYAIQGLGALLVARVEGSCSGVVGLPLMETLRLLQDAAGADEE